MSERDQPIIGWREWVGLPQLGVDAIKAKVDTGARSSSLHAYDVRIERRRGVSIVRFIIHPLQRDTTRTIEAHAELVDERWIKTSGGHETLRPVIVTELELLGHRHAIELTLINRDAMGFRMLLGREAVRRRYLVNPGRSFLGGRREEQGRPTRRKKKPKRSRE